MVSKFKNFLYLDSDRMFSISSQLLGGMVERIYSGTETRNTESEEQRGSVGSGRTLAHLAARQSSQQEVRSVHDFAYTLFERELERQCYLIDRFELLKMTSPAPPAIVKVSGSATFYDAKSVAHLLGKFNEFGDSLAYVGAYEGLRETRDQLSKLIDETKDRNQKAQLKRRRDSLTARSIARSQGLHQDEKFLEHLAQIVQYFYADDLELRVQLDDRRFANATLDRHYLRVDEQFLSKRYSNRPMFDITVLGLLTRIGGEDDPAHEDDEDVETEDAENGNEVSNMREGIRGMSMALGQLEETSFAPTSAEIILEPIAVYYEVATSQDKGPAV